MVARCFSVWRPERVKQVLRPHDKQRMKYQRGKRDYTLSVGELFSSVDLLLERVKTPET